LISESSPRVASGAPGRYFGMSSLPACLSVFILAVSGYQRTRTSSVGSRQSSRGSSLERSSGSLVVIESTPRGTKATKTRSSQLKGRSTDNTWVTSPVDVPNKVLITVGRGRNVYGMEKRQTDRWTGTK
jgi:hypothetical protein